MSLLEDVFLQDEANEAEQLERVIEGDEFEDRQRSDSDENSEKDNEAEEDKRRVDPTKVKTTRVIKNPRFILNPARLTGPRGIQVIPDHFKDFKFKGKGHEKEDLDLVLKRLEHWAYRLYPKFQFEDCLKKIEMLGKKRPVMVHLHKIRSDQFISEETIVQKDSSDEDTPMPEPEEDEFDKLLQQQIELARSTPAPGSTKKPSFDDVLNDHSSNKPGLVTPRDHRATSLMMPKATSSPSISEEQKERMRRNRELALERRLARLQKANNTNHTSENNDDINIITETVSSNKEPFNIVKETETDVERTDIFTKDSDDIDIVRKHNRSNVIDSSSSDEEIVAETNMSIVVDVHNTARSNTESCGKIRGTNEDNSINCGEDENHVEASEENYPKATKEGNIEVGQECSNEVRPENHIEASPENRIDVIQEGDNIEQENNIGIREENNLQGTQENLVDGEKNVNSVSDPLHCDDTTIAITPQDKDIEENSSEESSHENNLIIYPVENETGTKELSEINSTVTEVDLQNEDPSMIVDTNDQITEDGRTEKSINISSEALHKEMVDNAKLNKTENTSNNSGNVPVDDVGDLMDIDFNDDF